ncbi:hypothetical protein B9Z55_015646 [Caenorhabditis nigoni]|uniref:PAN-3 domain-containing protein n=1 Tax=Caenorhabditis nigoni TaxID=1611254 RepID=A0A2G5UBH1_9PELO|nr:hypothetical protein B9Z55_015646 [Caenorhabditis nigoni]
MIQTFLLLILIPQSLAIMKMIQIYGKVTYGPFPMTSPSYENCALECFNLDYCILSWQTPEGLCYHYSYLNRSDTITVVETGIEEESVVAFKTNITGTDCPISYTDMDFKMTIPSGDTYSWIKTGNSWGLNGCRDGWKRFDRVDGVSVCMQIYSYPDEIERWDARYFCKIMGTDQIGVASVDESQWIHDQMMEYNPSKTEPFAFWTGGEQHQNCTTTPTYCEIVEWEDGYTKGIAALDTSTNFDCKCMNKMCISVAYVKDDERKTVQTIHCHKWAPGYVCGYDLRKSG